MSHVIKISRFNCITHIKDHEVFKFNIAGSVITIERKLMIIPKQMAPELRNKTIETLDTGPRIQIW